MNVYSDASYSALKYLKDTEVNIQNLLIITEDFNIQDSLWDPSFPHHSSISDDLIIIADSFHLNLLSPINQVNASNANSVINLMFLWCDSSKLNNHSIHPDWCLSSDHTPLTVTIPISDEIINIHKRTIIKDSVEKESFIKDITASIRSLNTLNLSDITTLEKAVNDLAKDIDNA